MSSLKIHLLGQFKLQAGDQPLELTSRPAQSLLAYLVLNAGVKQRREKLALLLWPDAAGSNARSYLRQALWRVRKALTAASLTCEDYLQINDINIAFDQHADYWLDAEALLAAADGLSQPALTETLSLYRGELLSGFYEDWVVRARDRLQAAYHQKMNLLLQRLIQARQWDQLLVWSEEWIRLGYAPEPAFRGLIIAHAGLGDQGMVNAAYRRCVDSLQRELNVGPSPETLQLYEQIQRGEFQVAPSAPPRPDPDLQPPDFLLDHQPAPVEQPIFVARDAELASLQAYLDQALSVQGRVVFVTGEIGSGKTALLDEFTRRARELHPHLIIVRGECNAHTGLGDPYLPFREVMELLTGDVAARYAAGAIDQDHARQLWGTLPFTAQAILDVGPDLIDTFIAGTSLLERAQTFAPAPTDWSTRLESLMLRRREATSSVRLGQHDLFEGYFRVLRTLADRSPLVLVIDDLQWADLGSINLLFHLGRHLSPTRILIFGAYRPEEITLGRDGERHPLEPLLNEFQRHFGQITVNLSSTQGSDFIDAFLDSEANRLDAAFRQMLHRQTRGHPLFTIELLRGMQERGDLRRNADGGWEVGPTLDWETMPARVEAVIAGRISRLDSPLREALRVASVEGQVFTAEVVARVCNLPERELLGGLSHTLDRKHHIIRTHSIQRLGGQLISSYQFRHILFQKFLYGSLDEVERVHLHEAIGTTLEELYQASDARAAIAPRLARHFELARNIPKAIHYLHWAGVNAVQLSAYQEGIAHLHQGLSLLMTLPESPERDQQELDLQHGLGMAWVGPKAYGAETRTAYTRARHLCQKLGKNRQMCNVIGQLAILEFIHSNLLGARSLAEEALTLARQIDDPLLIALGHWYLGFIAYYMGDFLTAQAHTGHMIEFYRPEQHHQALVALRGSDSGISALGYEVCYLWIMGYPDRAYCKSLEVLVLARQLSHPFSLVDGICYAGCWFNALRRQPQTLLTHAEELLRLTVERRFEGWMETSISFFGEALALLGNTSEGIAKIQESIDLSRESLAMISSLRALADAYLQDGQPEKSLATLDQALILVADFNEHQWESEIYRLRGETYLALGDQAAAEASFQNALKVAQGQAAKSWELRSATALADLWRQTGKTEQARQLLAEVYDWFTEGFDTPDLKAARALLDQLS